MIGIYKITSPTRKIYVGQSIDIHRRWLDHKTDKVRSKLRNSFKKHGFENHKFEIKEECSIELLNERERYWQDFYDVLGPNGLNLRLTKVEDRSGTFSKESKDKMSNSQKIYNSTLTDEQKELKRIINSDSLKKYYKTASQEDIEFRNKRNSEGQRGRVFLEEHRQKLREKAIENSKTEEYKKKQKEGLTRYLENRTEEEKVERYLKQSKTLLNRTQEQKEEWRRKLQETCRLKRELKLNKGKDEGS